MKVQRDLTTVFYIFSSGIYLIIGARSFARAPDTLETSFFYLLGLVTWLLATLVWMQQTDNRAARISYLMSIGFMSICSIDASFSIDERTLSSRVLPIFQFLSATILPCLFLHCFLIFPVEKRIIQRREWLLKLLYAPGIVLFSTMSFLYLSGNDYSREFFLVHFLQFPLLEFAISGFLCAYSVTGQLLLLHSSFAAHSSSQRRQARWLLLGITAGTLPQAVLTAIPRVWDVSIPYVHLSAYALCFIPICYVVAIVRHRLMNIELIINRSVVYALVSGFALGMYLLSIHGLARFFHTEERSWAVTAVSIFIAAVLFAPAKTRIQNLIDRAFNREAYNYRQTLLALSQTLHSILDLEILVDTLLRQVTEAMHISRGVVMYRVTAADPTFVTEATVGMDSIQDRIQVRLSPSLVDLLNEADKPLDFSNQPLAPNSIKLLEAEALSQDAEGFSNFLRSAIWIPFVTRTKEQENLVGLLVLGQKLSEEPYTQTDLALLGTLAHQGATAIENATLYAQLSARTEAMENARQQLMATYLDTYGGTIPKPSSEVKFQPNEGDSGLVAEFDNIAAALKDSHDKLKQLDGLKSQFLDNVSHELRTPLTHIKGFVDNLLDGVGGELAERQKRYLFRVKDNCDRLIRLINNLLDLSRTESGKISLQLQQRLLYPILEETVAGIQPLLDKKEIHIELNCEKTLTALVDADKIRQIMTDLLDNAHKYTERGGYVRVVVTAVSNREVQICVEDSGIGIAETDLDFIFDRFHRVAGPRSNNTSGIGLGLPIVKNLVELHGGDVKVESELGKGSRFYIKLNR